jgi:hypothetical protein
MTIKQFILASELSVRELANIFHQSDLDFKPEEKALFIVDEQNMIAIGKDMKFRLFLR